MSTHHINSRLIQLSLSGLLLAVSMPLGAEFVLNFKPFGSSGSGGGGWGGGGTFGGFSNVECGSTSTGSTGSSGWGGNPGGSSGFSLGHGCGSGYFLQEVHSDGTFHVIVGDPADDFALEWYIKGSSDLVTGYLDNIDNPLGSNVSRTGNGAGNPTQVHFRQLIKDVSMDQETLKAKNALKPKITQHINEATLSSTFIADMTNSSYSQMFAGTITNLETVLDGGKPFAAGSFDMSKDSGKSLITAGKYTHPGGEFKNYTYASGGFDVQKVKWIDFCDPKQNPDHKCNISNSSGSGNSGWSSGGGGGW